MFFDCRETLGVRDWSVKPTKVYHTTEIMSLADILDPAFVTSVTTTRVTKYEVQLHVVHLHHSQPMGRDRHTRIRNE